MQVYPVTALFGLLLLLCALGGARWLLMLVAAMIPFGMMAVIGLPSVGGLSLLGVNVAASAVVAAGCIGLARRTLAGRAVRIQPAALALLCFGVYAAFSATVLVRLFAGETMVFALSRGATGVRVSTAFAWGKVWLGPSNANLSQTMYVLLACFFFIAACQILMRYGAAFGIRCMALAASLNLILGAMDLASLDALMTVIRTANYSLANEATVQGVPRIVGGYSEAASFGSASAMFFAFFSSAFLKSRRFRDALLAVGNGIFALLALSSTGIIAMAVVCIALLPRLLVPLRSRMGRGLVLGLAVLLALGGIVVAAVLVFTAAPEMIYSVIDDLILNKTQSSSGMERTAWAMGGLEALRDTWGLGAGTGSLRSNGLPFVLLGNVGVIGTAAFLAFLWLSFRGRAAPGQAESLANARVAALSVLVTLTLSATVPDPGIPLVFLAAIAVASRHAPHSAGAIPHAGRASPAPAAALRHGAG